jgi:hypothetical protein
LSIALTRVTIARVAAIAHIANAQHSKAITIFSYEFLISFFVVAEKSEGIVVEMQRERERETKFRR